MNNVGNYVFMKLCSVLLFRFHSVSVIIPSRPPSQGCLPCVFSCMLCWHLKFYFWSPSSHFSFYFWIFIYSHGFNYYCPASDFQILPTFFTYLKNTYTILIATDISIWKFSWFSKLLMSNIQFIVSSSYMNGPFPHSPFYLPCWMTQKYGSHPDPSFSLILNF